MHVVLRRQGIGRRQRTLGRVSVELGQGPRPRRLESEWLSAPDLFKAGKRDRRSRKRTDSSRLLSWKAPVSNLLAGLLVT